MTIYYCPCCEYKTNHKSHFKKHLQTKRHKKCAESMTGQPSLTPVGMTGQPKKCKKSDKNRESNNKICKIVTHNDNNTNVKNNVQKSANNKKYVCIYCNKCFKQKQGLSKHKIKHCKMKPSHEVEELKLLLQHYSNEVISVKKENMELKNQIEEILDKFDSSSKFFNQQISKNNTYNTNNGINNSININNYKDTNYDFLTDVDYIKCLKTCNHCVKSFIEKVHFNPEHPENMNICVKSTKGKFMLIYKNNKWNIADCKKELDSLFETSEIQLENWYDEYKEKYPHVINSMKRYLRNKEMDDELVSRVKDEIFMMLYNNRGMITEKET
jgi:hypothetical protein